MALKGKSNKKLMIIGISIAVVIIVLFFAIKLFQPSTSQKSAVQIEYSPVNRDCVSTEFVKGFKENTEIDYLSKKDSCGFELKYEQGDKYAGLQLNYPISSTLQKLCSTGKDVSDLDKGIWAGSGKVVDEQAMTLDGKSAYKIITEDSGYNYITVYVCLGAKTYNWGGSPVNALFVWGAYTDNFQTEVVDHALANWHWK